MMKNVFRTLSVFLALVLAVSLLLTSRPAEARKHRRHHRPTASRTVKDTPVPPAQGRAGAAGVAAGAAAGAAAGHLLSGHGQEGHEQAGHVQPGHVQGSHAQDGNPQGSNAQGGNAQGGNAQGGNANAQGGHVGACRTGTERCIAVAALPVQAQETLKLILAGGPFPYEKDGTVFGNYEGRLPRQRRGYYTEYTVRTPHERSRGARRIIAGGRPGQYSEFFYTADHYQTFRRIDYP